jgi:hypothetical protein
VIVQIEPIAKGLKRRTVADTEAEEADVEVARRFQVRATDVEVLERVDRHPFRLLT